MIVFALTGAPASEPVSASALRTHAHLRATVPADAELEAFLLSARHLVERYTGRSLIAQTWTASFETWPTPDDDGRIRIRLSPFPASVASVAVDGVALASTLYTLRGDELVFDIDLASLPEGDDVTDGVVITFTSSPALTACPPLGLAIKQLAAHFCEHREPLTDEQLVGVLGLGHILSTYRVIRELN